MFGIRRREFISLIGGAATAWPLAARAQRRAKPARIGYLSSSSPPDIFLESFIRGMGVVGYGEGRDFVLEARYAGRDYNKFQTNGPFGAALPISCASSYRCKIGNRLRKGIQPQPQLSKMFSSATSPI